jgi:uncharacterized protein (DUF2147 family)
MRTANLISATIAAALIALSYPANAAGPSGTWTRPNGETAQVSQKGDRLFCKIVSGKLPGFEMCHGMSKTGDGVWQGASMKHPEMPGFMTFNGTVTVEMSSLTIKGCAIGQVMCDAETWKRK